MIPPSLEPTTSRTRAKMIPLHKGSEPDMQEHHPLHSFPFYWEQSHSPVLDSLAISPKDITGCSLTAVRGKPTHWLLYTISYHLDHRLASIQVTSDTSVVIPPSLKPTTSHTWGKDDTTTQKGLTHYTRLFSYPNVDLVH